MNNAALFTSSCVQLENKWLVDNNYLEYVGNNESCFFTDFSVSDDNWLTHFTAYFI